MSGRADDRRAAGNKWVHSYVSCKQSAGYMTHTLTTYHEAIHIQPYTSWLRICATRFPRLLQERAYLRALMNLRGPAPA